MGLSPLFEEDSAATAEESMGQGKVEGRDKETSNGEAFAMLHDNRTREVPLRLIREQLQHSGLTLPA